MEQEDGEKFGKVEFCLWFLLINEEICIWELI